MGVTGKPGLHTSTCSMKVPPKRGIRRWAAHCSTAGGFATEKHCQRQFLDLRQESTRQRRSLGAAIRGKGNNGTRGIGMNVNITFLGGSGTVTGSKYLVRHNGKSLLVDCGLFQGYKQLRLRNWQPLPVTPHQIDAVVLTHAHLDHSGYLPLLARDGYTRAIHCTPGTRDLCTILLPDSGHIQEEDAAFANRKGFSKHSPALPLYTESDAIQSLKLFRTVPMHQPFEPLKGWTARFSGAGHILGAASLLLEV
eukprot:gene28594-50463_t